MNIWRSLNSRDSFPGRKFKNRAPTSCSPGPVLSPPIITFELHAKTAEEMDLEKCTFRNFGSSVTLTLTLDRVEVTLVCISGQGLPTHQITWKSEKLFVDVRTDVRKDGWTDTTSNSRCIRSSPRRWPNKNRALTSCSPGPMVWPPTISFELHAKTAEEIALEKCTFRNFGSSVTLTLTLDRVEVILVRICGRSLPTHQIRWKSEKKLFVDVLLGHR